MVSGQVLMSKVSPRIIDAGINDDQELTMAFPIHQHQRPRFPHIKVKSLINDGPWTPKSLLMRFRP